MTDRPILFSAPMIRALIAGRKTQTRRLLKLPKKTFSGGPIYERPDMGGWEPTTSGGGGCFIIGNQGERIPYPERVAIWHKTTGVCMETPWQPGDRLWIRETWTATGTGVWTIADARARIATDQRIVYRADGGDGPWWSSLFLPREFSRLTLTVTDVLVQQLQDISEDDAQAEGIWQVKSDDEDNGCFTYLGASDFVGCWSAKSAFAKLWDSLNAKRAPWASNPWVCALTFTVGRHNIDDTP